MSLLLAGLLLFSGPARAHGAHDGAAQSEMAPAPDVEQGVSQAAGHCHGGAYCNGAALAVVVVTPPRPVPAGDVQPIRGAAGRLQAVPADDPPPPRPQS
ncbi:hypothetical protein [Shimia sp.]|uniref:hypothetical protein n=1 Tax=Shimia sp. TaxID=1954381 RepID=UPI00356899EA